MAYTERREGPRGVRYRGMYKDTDGRYKSAGTHDTEERALSVAQDAEKHAAALIGGATGGLDPVIRATRTIEEYKPIFLRHHRVEGNTKDTYADTLRLHVIPFLGKVRLAETDRTVARNYFTALEEAGRSANVIRQAKVVLAAMFGMAISDGYLDFNPFHDVKTPKVPGRRAIKVVTTEQYLKVRGCLPTSAARIMTTVDRDPRRLAAQVAIPPGIMTTCSSGRGRSPRRRCCDPSRDHDDGTASAVSHAATYRCDPSRDHDDLLAGICWHYLEKSCDPSRDHDDHEMEWDPPAALTCCDPSRDHDDARRGALDAIEKRLRSLQGS